LKTAGLLAGMAQCGLHIPAAEGSELEVFQGIYVDIGDEQSIEQSLSTFSSHISNIVRILRVADARSLVLLDELGAGTDPGEGAALARALLVEFLDRGCLTLVATHYPELKAFAHLTEGVQNASVEFDLETLQPTYRLTVGLPGRSNALAIAERLGLRKRIVEAARAELSPDDLRADSMLEEIRRQRDAAAQSGAEAEQASLEARSLRDELRRRLDEIAEERNKILEQARQEAGAELEAARRQLVDLRRRLMAAGEPLQAVGDINEELEQLKRKVEAPNPQPVAELPGLESDWKELAVGDRVIVSSIGAEGVVTALEGEQAEVQLGRLRIRAATEELAALPMEPGFDSPVQEGRRPPPARSTFSEGWLPTPSVPPPLELHVRGQTVEEALEQLERSLDAAYLAGAPFLRVVHGKGTGRLREAIRQALKDSGYVASFNSGTPAEGGEGVTVVWMAQD